MTQRGATLTGYALIFSLITVASLGGLRALEDGSTEVLEATGDSIGDARPTRDQLAASIEAEDPDGSIDDGDDEPSPTYDWQTSYTGIIETPQGFCLSDVGGDVQTATCSTAASSSLEFVDNIDDDTNHVQLQVGGLCVTRIGDDQPVALAACQDGNDDQMWLQTPSGNLANAGSPGQCLDVEGGGVGSAGAQIFSWNCHGGANQTFSFPGPWVPPPTADVTSVNASEAVLTGAFEIDADGYLFAPNGTGNSYNSPGGAATAAFTFTVTDGGPYRISGEVLSANGGDDSFWVTTSLDGDSADYLWDTACCGSPTADFVNDRSNGRNDVVIDVPAGATFTITLWLREDGTRLRNLSVVPV